MSIVRTAIIMAFAGGLSLSAYVAPPKFPKPAPKLPGGGKTVPKLPPADIQATAYKIGTATQVLGSKPRLQILLKTPVPKRYRVFLIEWGDKNRSWQLPTQTWTKTNITATLPEPLHSNVKHLSGRYEVAIYDPSAKKLVSNKVEIRPAKGNKVYLSNVKVYAKELLTGRFEVAFDGVNLLPAGERRLQYRVVVPKHPEGVVGVKRTTSVRATQLAEWNETGVDTGFITFHPPEPPDWKAMKIHGQGARRSYRAMYTERVMSEGYVELRVLDANNKPLSSPVKIPGRSWILDERPKAKPGVDHDGDGYDSIASGGDDCDDNNHNRYPTNTEIPDFDGNDEDCDPETIGELDRDKDGFKDYRLSNHKHYPQSPHGRDCDDFDVQVNPLNTGEDCADALP